MHFNFELNLQSLFELQKQLSYVQVILSSERLPCQMEHLLNISFKWLILLNYKLIVPNRKLFSNLIYIFLIFSPF